MPNFGNLINYRRQEMPKYGTVRLLWPCQPWKWLTEVTEHSQRTVLKKSNASENLKFLNGLNVYLSNLMLALLSCGVK